MKFSFEHFQGKHDLVSILKICQFPLPKNIHLLPPCLYYYYSYDDEDGDYEDGDYEDGDYEDGDYGDYSSPFVQAHTCSFSLSIIAYVLLLRHHVLTLFLSLNFFKSAVAIKLSNLLICFCSFDLFCPILEKDSFIEKLYIVLSCLIK